MRGANWKVTSAVALLSGSACAIDFNAKDEKSVQNAASVVAKNTMSDYAHQNSSNIPGKLDAGWYAGGVLFDTLIRYWYYTGDTSYNDAVSKGLYWQRGDNNDFFPANYSQFLANDDQMMWAFAAMTAAELNYPRDTSMPSWITLAENVFNDQVRRWDDHTCGGGLRWQIWPYQSGWTLKNAISNGGLFELSARLARFTGNQTYSDWAEKVWDWSTASQLVNNVTWAVADSTATESDCTDRSHLTWSWDTGVYMTGAAYMYNLTNGNTKWKSGVDGLLNGTAQFFPKHGYNNDDGTVMVEIDCESTDSCDSSMWIMKGAFIQSLAQIAVAAPYTLSKILPLLQGSATAAAMTCTGGDTQNLCGGRWYYEKFDAHGSIDTQMAALSLFTSNLVAFDSRAPGTQSTVSNGTSTTAENGTTTSNTTSTGAAGATKTGSNGGNVLTSSAVGATAAIFAALLALF